jgi:hypothetical protein
MTGMEEVRKPVYESPALRLIAMNLEVNFTLSDPIVTPPFEDDQDW